MIDRIIDLSVRNKGVVFLSVLIACLFGWWALTTMHRDALPDLGETQVIVYSQWDRAPDLVESQVTFPIVSAMLGAPHVKAVRGFSDFGYSYVYVIFDEDTDLYWARSRTLEFLSSALTRLPEGVKTEIGPDATSLGWIFQYALVVQNHQHSLAELRSYQDWYLRYYLKAIPGVADVAPVGGFTRQYQVNVNPDRLQVYGITTRQVVDAIREGNGETSGRLLEFGGSEYMIRGRGYATSLEDFENIVVAPLQDGTSVRIRDLGTVSYGPDLRRGVADLNGNGEAVSGIVIMRSGEDALQVIGRVKHKLDEIAPGMPQGLKIVPVYDRSLLIHRTLSTARKTILEIMLTVAVIIILFLWHPSSAIIPLVTMPAALVLTFIPLRLLHVGINVMSLAGVAIAAGELIDASILVVEQTHKRLEQWQKAGRPGDSYPIVLSAVKEVAGPTFFTLLVIAISFLPVLTLEGEEGRMFRPLAYSKSAAMIIAALLAITLDPALRLFFSRTRQIDFGPNRLRGFLNALVSTRIFPEERNILSRSLTRLYEPVVRWTLRWKWLVLGSIFVLLVVTIRFGLSLGSEFMPPMDEGSILYMPTTLPGISIAQAQRVLQATDAILKSFPEVDTVLGKAGRADTATDPAPLSMFETIITLKPQSSWPHIHTWYSDWSPDWATPAFRHITLDHITSAELVTQMDGAIKAPGFSNAWTMPIKGRIDMLSSGIRTPVGLKISGGSLKTIEEIGKQIAAALPAVKGTRSVFAERTNTGHFIDITWKRDELARYGITMEQAQQVVNSAIGGDNVSTVFAGQARYPVNVRYMRDFRSSLESLSRIIVSADTQHQAMLGTLATVQIEDGPAMIRDENGLLTGYVFVDIADRDPGTYIAAADRLLKTSIHLPPGYVVSWSGQFEAIERARQRLQFIVPATLALVALLLYLNTRSFAKTLIVLMAVPFSAIGAIWFVHFLHYNMSVAVWVGLLGLMSIDAETGVFMLLYLDLACADAKKTGRLENLGDLREAIVYGAARRLRPKFMTFATTCIGLVPILWSVGAGADVMKRVAAPMVGGIFSSFLLELVAYPAIYELWKRNEVTR